MNSCQLPINNSVKFYYGFTGVSLVFIASLVLKYVQYIFIVINKSKKIRQFFEKYDNKIQWLNDKIKWLSDTTQWLGELPNDNKQYLISCIAIIVIDIMLVVFFLCDESINVITVMSIAYVIVSFVYFILKQWYPPDKISVDIFVLFQIIFKIALLVYLFCGKIKTFTYKQYIIEAIYIIYGYIMYKYVEYQLETKIRGEENT